MRKKITSTMLYYVCFEIKRYKKGRKKTVQFIIAEQQIQI